MIRSVAKPDLGLYFSGMGMEVKRLTDHLNIQTYIYQT